MTARYEIDANVPMPDLTLGRKIGAKGSDCDIKHHLIMTGVMLLSSDVNYFDAARIIKPKWPRKPITVGYLAKLISKQQKKSEM